MADQGYFHTTDALWFKRLENGDVHIMKKSDNSDTSSVLWEETVPKEAWLSIICHVSHILDVASHDLAELLHLGKKEEAPAAATTQSASSVATTVTEPSTTTTSAEPESPAQPNS